MSKLKEKLMLSEKGYSDLKKAITACTITNIALLLPSIYLLGVNPFDQPGVEAYKKNMFALLGKPGYEEMGEELRKRLR